MTAPIAAALAALLLLAVPGGAVAGDPIRVVASTTTLRSIAESVGGDRIEAVSIATGYQNPHFVDPKPSFILKLSRADLFVGSGLDLETGWVPSLLQSSRNGRIQPGGAGYIDASVGVELLQRPQTADRSQGDIHVYGNPHYWMDPLRGKQIARTIARKLIALRPAEEAFFRENLRRFEAEIDTGTARWTGRLAALRDLPVIAYHNEWPYFEERFGFTIVDFLEPKPGIPPSPGQLRKVIAAVEARKIPLIITSPYFTPDAANLVSRETGARVVVLATAVEAFDGIDTYLDLFEYNTRVLLAALSAGGDR